MKNNQRARWEANLIGKAHSPPNPNSIQLSVPLRDTEKNILISVRSATNCFKSMNFLEILPNLRKFLPKQSIYLLSC